MRTLIALLLVVWPLDRIKAEANGESTTGKLPNDIVPRNYTIHVEPDYSSLRTAGAEDIEIEVLKPTNRIVLNAINTTISDASLSGAGDLELLSAQFDPVQETVSFLTREQLATGTYHLSFRFESRIERPGLFLQHYQSAGQQRQLLATQFEPGDARRMFPCWDDPAFCATFRLAVKTDSENTVVSNMPEAGEQQFGASQKIVIFEPTPKMATYQLALVCGDNLEWIDDEIEGVKLRVLTTGGRRDYGRYAIDATKQILPFYSDYFGIRYPLPKLDQIALPAGFGATRGTWGIITYSEDELLHEPEDSSELAKQRVFSATAHQIAGQWLGNLVAMAGPDTSWLSEALTWCMQDKVADHFNPDWKVWLQALVDKGRAMQADERRTADPGSQSVASDSHENDPPGEINSIKGRFLFRMIESFLGPIPFRNGIRAYLAANKYSSASAAGLWEALEQSSRKPIQKLARNWVEKPRFPLIRMTAQCMQGNRIINLEQSPFALTETESSPVQWYVPVAITSTEHVTDPKYAVLDKLSDSFAFPGCDGALIGNAGGAGLFRVWYEPALLSDLLGKVSRLPESDLLTLVSDQWAMVESHRISLSSYLDLVEALRSNSSYFVWYSIITSLKLVDQLQQGQPGREAFQKFVCSLLEPQLESLGWTGKADDNFQTRLMRSQLINTLGLFGDRAVIDEAFRRFEEFQKYPESLAGDLRPAVVQIVGRYSSETTYNQLCDLAKQNESNARRNMYLQALQTALDPDLARRTLQSVLADEMAPAEALAAFERVAVGAGHAGIAWDFAKEHLDELRTRWSSPYLKRLLPSIAAGFSDEHRADELAQLTKEKLPPEAMSDAESTANLIRARARLKTQLPAIDAYVQQRMAQQTPDTAQPEPSVIGEK